MTFIVFLLCVACFIVFLCIGEPTRFIVGFLILHLAGLYLYLALKWGDRW